MSNAADERATLLPLAPAIALSKSTTWSWYYAVLDQHYLLEEIQAAPDANSGNLVAVYIGTVKGGSADEPGPGGVSIGTSTPSYTLFGHPNQQFLKDPNVQTFPAMATLAGSAKGPIWRQRALMPLVKRGDRLLVVAQNLNEGTGAVNVDILINGTPCDFEEEQAYRRGALARAVA